MSPNTTAAQKQDATLKMSTLSEALNHAVKDGFVEDFKFENGALTSGKDNHYSPEDVKISNFYRFEGYSDPDENSILYLIETTDGKKGTLVDAYGAYSDAKLATFIRAVEEITKK
ncbi:hypothetical protein WBG78_21455 [Chryseolinea sp. T2]|uniref:hypothetical protein n=1 Tax=Chryseolinea sp. T2 TaxID=3129255 RepID=UPI0030779625